MARASASSLSTISTRRGGPATSATSVVGSSAMLAMIADERHSAEWTLFRRLLRRAIANSRQHAQVRSQHALRAAPHQKEQGFAAPAADRMAGDEAGPFGGCKHRLRGSQDQAIGLRADFGGGVAAVTSCREVEQFPLERGG